MIKLQKNIKNLSLLDKLSFYRALEKVNDNFNLFNDNLKYKS